MIEETEELQEKIHLSEEEYWTKKKAEKNTDVNDMINYYTEEWIWWQSSQTNLDRKSSFALKRLRK
jgi:hypothetical protein